MKNKSKTPPRKIGAGKSKTVAQIKIGNGLVPVSIKTHKDRNGGHPHVIMGDVDNMHVSVGLSTQKKKGKNSPNYKLSVNPLGENTQSYMRRQGTVAPKGEYERSRKGAMAQEDYKKAKEYGDKAKRKYLKKKDKKK